MTKKLDMSRPDQIRERILTQCKPNPTDVFFSVKHHTKGNWQNILQQLGIDSNCLNGKHQPCPSCGGKDRFRFDDKHGRGTFFCNSGGNPVAGDGFKLLEHIYGWDFKESSRRIENLQIKTPISTPIKLPTSVKSTSGYARQLWQRASKNFKAHPYAITKGIDWPAGTRRGQVSGRIVGKNSDCLIIPIRDLKTSEVFAIQAINANGKKQTFGQLKGNALLLGNTLNLSIPWYVCEGWATGVSLVFHHNHGNACCGVAFGKSNLETVANVIADIYRPKEIIIMEEQDG